MQVPKLNESSARAWLILGGGALLIVIVAVYLTKTFGGIGRALGSLTDSLGLTDSEETKATKEAVKDAKSEAESNASPWNPLFYQQAPTGAKLFTAYAGNEIARAIWDSVGIFTTDINEVIAAIKKCSTKSQVSFVSKCFTDLYQKDLLSWITLQYTKMGAPDPGIATVTNYVSKLPNYN